MAASMMVPGTQGAWPGCCRSLNAGQPDHKYWFREFSNRKGSDMMTRLGLPLATGRTVAFATATALVFALSPAQASDGAAAGIAKVQTAVTTPIGGATDFSAARRHRHSSRGGGAAAAAAFAGIVGTIGAIAAAQASRDAYYDGPYAYGGGPYYASPYYGRPYYGRPYYDHGYGGRRYDGGGNIIP
jgi:hypothetical protein